MKLHKFCSSVALGALLFAGTQAHAQDATAESNVSDPAPEPQSGLGDIVVTAQRRSENLQRAAVAITAVSGDSLQSAGVSNPAQLSALVPALQVTAGNGAFNFYLRGVGNFNGNALSDSAIAFNYDGIYIGRPSGTTAYFYDLERVEVLKGPQGTLYGRNATGGAINVIPKKPRFELGGDFSAEYGNYDALRLEGAINVPLSDKVAMRASGILVQHDGYMSDGTDDQKDVGGRLQLLLQPTSDLEINLSADYFHQGGNGAGSTPVALGPDNRFGLSSPEGQAFSVTQPHSLGGTFFSATPKIWYQDNNFWGISATVNWKTNIGTLTIIPAYREGHLKSQNDTVGFYAYQDEQTTQKSLEVRLASADNGPLRYLIGGYYYRDETKAPIFAINNIFNYSYQRLNPASRSLAAFGRLTYAITNEFRITGGVRYTDEKKTFNGDLLAVDRICLAGFLACPGAEPFPLGPPARPNVVVLADGTVVPQFLPNGILQVGSTIHSDVSAKFSRVTWRASADWDITPQNLLYASYETGFKSGGFFFSSDNGVYRPEKIQAWTIGSKNRFLDNRLQLNVEAFLWKYKDQQISHLGLDSRGLAIFPTENVGAATFKGVEIEARVLPTSNTLLGADIQYLDGKYDDFVYSFPNLGAPPSANCAVTVASPLIYNVNCSGKRPPQAPEWTINLSAQQTIPLGNSGKIVADARTHYQSRTLTSLEFLNDEYQSGYWSSDLALTYYAPNERWFIGGYVNNVENTTIKGGSFVIPFNVSNQVVAILRPPRTYGVRAGVRF